MSDIFDKAIADFNKKHMFDNVRIRRSVEDEMKITMDFKFAFELSQYSYHICFLKKLNDVVMPIDFIGDRLEDAWLEAKDNIPINLQEAEK